MSKLQQLMDELCPNGVEYKELCKITDMSAGDRITKANMHENYKYPVIGGGVLPTGFYSKFNREKCITIARAGSAGFVSWQENRFWATDVCFTSTLKENNDSINLKFIYYILKDNEKEFKGQLYGASMPKLNKNYLWVFPIPIPPIEVQEEIVKILDNFTNLTAELTAELTARKKQYEYYRDDLLIFDNSIKRKKLNEIFKIQGGYTPSKNKKEFWDGGDIPWYRMDDIRKKGRILSSSMQYVTKEGARKIFKTNSIILATTATIGEHALIKHDFIANQQFTIFTILDDIDIEINIKYIFYYFYIISEKSKNNLSVSSFPSVNMKWLKNLEISIPSIEIQEEIVRKLDMFDKLVNDLNEGLPAEIEMRQKQYEYYRKKLLTFKKL